jgi:hypothetical protein
MGISDAKDAQPNELFVKLSNKLVLDASGGSFGTGFSNADRDFIQASTANIANTPEGNRSILQLATKVEQRKQVIAQRARDYAKRNGGRIDGGFDDELSAWAGQNPMFSEKELAAVAGAKPQGAPKLNPGTIVVQNGVRFQIQPDGSGKAMQ